MPLFLLPFDLPMKPALPAVLVLLLLAAPAQAAPTLGPLKPCYVAAKSDGVWTTETISVTGSGFTPGADILLQLDGNAAGRAIAGSDGSLVSTLSAPSQNSGEREFTITAIDPTLGPVTATTLVTRLHVTVSPRKAKPTQTVTFTGRGFTTPDLPVFAHYTLRGKNRTTVRLAQPAGPCGTFSVKRRQFPMRRPATAEWLLRIDQDRRFRPVPTTAFVDLKIAVRNLPKLRG
jgi:hypothetical protein